MTIDEVQPMNSAMNSDPFGAHVLESVLFISSALFLSSVLFIRSVLFLSNALSTGNRANDKCEWAAYHS